MLAHTELSEFVLPKSLNNCADRINMAIDYQK